MAQIISIKSNIDSRPFTYLVLSCLAIQGLQVALLTSNPYSNAITDENQECRVRSIEIIPGVDVMNIDDVIDKIKDSFQIIFIDNIEYLDATKNILLLPFCVDDLIELDLTISDSNTKIILFGKSYISRSKVKLLKEKNKSKKEHKVWEISSKEDSIIESVKDSFKFDPVPTFSDVAAFETAQKLLTPNKKQAQMIADLFGEFIPNKQEFLKGVLKNHECFIKTNSSIIW